MQKIICLVILISNFAHAGWSDLPKSLIDLEGGFWGKYKEYSFDKEDSEVKLIVKPYKNKPGTYLVAAQFVTKYDKKTNNKFELYYGEYIPSLNAIGLKEIAMGWRTNNSVIEYKFDGSILKIEDGKAKIKSEKRYYELTHFTKDVTIESKIPDGKYLSALNNSHYIEIRGSNVSTNLENPKNSYLCHLLRDHEIKFHQDLEGLGTFRTGWNYSVSETVILIKEGKQKYFILASGSVCYGEPYSTEEVRFILE